MSFEGRVRTVIRRVQGLPDITVNAESNEDFLFMRVVVFIGGSSHSVQEAGLLFDRAGAKRVNEKEFLFQKAAPPFEGE
jgi:hypothetical protein